MTDTYLDVSIKNIGRLRRGSGDTFLIRGPKTKIPQDWKKFLANGKNEEPLVNRLHSEWSQNKYAPTYMGEICTYHIVTSALCLQARTGPLSNIPYKKTYALHKRKQILK